MADTSYLKENLNGVVPIEISKEIIKNVIDQASMLKICKKEPMESDKKDLPYLTGSGSASWVGEGETIGSSIPTFTYPRLEAKKLAVIIPVTREKVNDSVVAVMNELKLAIADSFAKAIDQAMIFGIDSPFTTNLLSATATNKVTASSNDSTSMDSNISDAMALVEANKFGCTNVLMGYSQKNNIRLASNCYETKDRITLNSAFDTPIEFVRDFDDTKALMFTGDFSKAIIGTRENIEYQVLDQATIGTGSSAINLAERDMIAIKATMRLGFVIVDKNAFSCVVSAE